MDGANEICRMDAVKLDAPPPRRYLGAVGGGSACASSLRFAIDE